MKDSMEGTKLTAAHEEAVGFAVPRKGAWKLSRSGDGDTAMALFSEPDEVDGYIDPKEERRLERKIDFMILPYLAVCYAFFYIDKTTLSYAAIFNIQEDLHLKGTEYSWLSSIFYFGFLAWAIPTNFLMQRLPIGKSVFPFCRWNYESRRESHAYAQSGKYLGANIFMWYALSSRG